MVCNVRSVYTSNVFLYAIFVILILGIIPDSAYGKEPIEQITKKHEKSVYELAKKGDLKRLVIRMFIIKRDVDNYLHRGIDEKWSMNSHIDNLIKEICKKHPEIKFNKNDIRNFKAFIHDLNMRLPTDFWLERYRDDINQSPLSGGITPSVDIGLTTALCGTFLCCIPVPGCQSIGLALVGFGGNMAYSGIVQKMDDDHKRNEEKRKRERARRRRQCSQCSKKCDECEFCRQRNNL